MAAETDPRILDRENTLLQLKKYGLKSRDLESWVKKFKVLRNNAQKRGIECSLKLSQYVRLAIRANLTRPDQIGRKSGEYNLSRKGDVGGYEWGNCRFLPLEENLAEKYKNGGIESMAAKRRGLTKHNNAGMRGTADKQSKHYRFVSPQGKVYTGLCVKDFAKEHGLYQGNLSRVCRGEAQSYKGWTGSYVE